MHFKLDYIKRVCAKIVDNKIYYRFICVSFYLHKKRISNRNELLSSAKLVESQQNRTKKVKTKLFNIQYNTTKNIFNIK